MPDMTTFELPKRVEIEQDESTETYGKFVVEPLEKGFGHTLGNALRRVMLSSLEGISVSSINIDGCPHEFSTLDGVIEDVTDVVLNFKRIKFECSGDLPRKLELHVNKDGDVTAADIAVDSVTKIFNPEQHICTIDSARELRIEIEISSGRGYCPSEENKREDQPIGVIPIDCLYSPVSRVAYSVHDCRVGQRTDYDRLELEVWTDGRVEPADAVKQASQILVHHLGLFTGIDGKDEDDTSSLITNPEDEELLRKLLTNCSDLELSVRAQNCLNSANITTIGEMIQRSEAEMLKYRNFGQKSLNELKEKIVEMGMSLNMEISEPVRIAFEKEMEKQRKGVSE